MRANQSSVLIASSTREWSILASVRLQDNLSASILMVRFSSRSVKMSSWSFLLELSTALDMMEGKSSAIIFSFAEKGSHTLLTSRERLACGGTGGLVVGSRHHLLELVVERELLGVVATAGFSDDDRRIVSAFIPAWCSFSS